MSATNDPTLPPCFGVLWQAIDGTYCDGCPASNECLVEFVSTTMLKAVERIGGEVGLDALAAELRIPVAAVTSALDFARSWRTDQQAVVETDQHTETPKKKAKRKAKPRKKSVKKSTKKKTKAPKKKAPKKRKTKKSN